MQYVGHLLSDRASQFWGLRTQLGNDLFMNEMEQAGVTCRNWRTKYEERDNEYEDFLRVQQRELTERILREQPLTIVVVGDNECGGPGGNWEDAWEALGNPQSAMVGSISVFTILAIRPANPNFHGQDQWLYADDGEYFDGPPSQAIPQQIKDTGESLQFLASVSSASEAEFVWESNCD